MKVCDEAKYGVFAFEIGEKGTPHIQGYVFYDNPRFEHAMRKKLPHFHIEMAKGTAEHNQTYIVGPYTDPKTGKYKPYNINHYQVGNVPASGRVAWERIEEVMSDPKSNPQMYMMYHKIYDNIKRMEKLNHVGERNRLIFALDYRFENGFLQHHKEPICTDPVCYDGERILLLHEYSEFNYKNWLFGHPPKLRRGFEIVTVDPDFVVMIFDSLFKKTRMHDFKEICDDIDVIILECAVSPLVEPPIVIDDELLATIELSDHSSEHSVSSDDMPCAAGLFKPAPGHPCYDSDLDSDLEDYWKYKDGKWTSGHKPNRCSKPIDIQSSEINAPEIVEGDDYLLTDMKPTRGGHW